MFCCWFFPDHCTALMTEFHTVFTMSASARPPSFLRCFTRSMDSSTFSSAISSSRALDSSLSFTSNTIFFWKSTKAVSPSDLRPTRDLPASNGSNTN